MKKYLIIIIGLLGSIMTNAHEQNVHRYIVTEAWKLLKYQKPELNNTLMANYIGDINNTTYLTSIVAGSHCEDIQDIVYMNCGFNLNLFGVEFIPCVRTTINHFWDADFGDNTMVTIMGSDPNALQKAENMWYGT